MLFELVRVKWLSCVAGVKREFADLDDDEEELYPAKKVSHYDLSCTYDDFLEAVLYLWLHLSFIVCPSTVVFSNHFVLLIMNNN